MSQSKDVYNTMLLDSFSRFPWRIAQIQCKQSELLKAEQGSLLLQRNPLSYCHLVKCFLKTGKTWPQ